jgi:NAD(P)-dependent dehydrogenase (short-subunit alcohol dehydrogenase family)
MRQTAFMEDLSGRVAVVTGAASGIGLGMAKAFAAQHMKVVLADIDSGELELACNQLTEQGAVAIAVPTDVTDPGAVEALRDAAVSAFGAAHLVCNNAGVAVGGPIWQVPLEAWQWVFGVNFWGVVHGLRAFVPLLLEQGEGHVVNTASAAGLVGTPFLGPYSATKHAVVAVSESLAIELAGTPVGVSVLCPLWVRTRIHESDRNAPPGLAELIAEDPASLTGAREVVAGFINSGLAPETVAEHVVEAVKAKVFWVFPHDEIRAAVRARGESIANGELPSFSLLT